MVTNNNNSELIFTDVNELISKLTQLAVNKNNVFRGYGKQSELLPNIIREKDWSPQEIRLLYEFEKYGLQYFSANSPIDFMSYAQHYGLPTRLLDFTYNPFTALSFALFMPKSTKYIERVHDLLKEGFKRYKREDNYANIASVGSFIKRKDPTFDVHNYGFSKLSDLIMSFPNKYEVKKEDAHKVPVVVYRCLSS